MEMEDIQYFENYWNSSQVNIDDYRYNIMSYLSLFLFLSVYRDLVMTLVLAQV